MIAAASGKGPGWLIADGETGLLSPIEDHRMLAAAISLIGGRSTLLLAWLAQGTNGSRPSSRILPSLRNSQNFLRR